MEIKWEDIPDSVFEGMEKVRQSGKYNMFDSQNVFVELYNLEYYEAVEWLLDPKWEEGSCKHQVDRKKYAAVLKNWNMPQRILDKLNED